MYVGCGDIKIRDVMDSSILVKLPLRDGRHFIIFCLCLPDVTPVDTEI